MIIFLLLKLLRQQLPLRYLRRSLASRRRQRERGFLLDERD